MYEEHYTISAAPAFYLLLAFMLIQLRKLVPLIISLGVLLIMIVPGLGNYYTNGINEQWREAALYRAGKLETDEVLFLLRIWVIGIQQKSFYWYYHGNLPSTVSQEFAQYRRR